MKMKPWEIWEWKAPAAGEYVVVVLGTEERLSHKAQVSVLVCPASGAKRKVEIFEVILDETEGLDRETICRCDLVYTVRKDELVKQRGTVSEPRRREIAERLVRGLGLAGI